MPENLYRRGQTWWARLQRGGHEYRRSLRTADRKEARRRLADLEGAIGHAIWHGEERHTFQEAALKWNAEWLPQSVRPSTADRYRLSLKALDPHFGELFVDQITARAVARFVSARGKSGVTNATVRRDLTALSTILSCCVAWQWRDDNPARAFDRSTIRERRDPVLLPTDGAILAVILKAPQMYGRLLLTLFQTGMRLQEGGGLAPRQIDVPGRTLALEMTKTRSRRIEISDATAGTISGTPRHQSNRWLFWHGQGERYRNLSSNLARLIGRALNPSTPKGAKPLPRFPTFRVHDLRHRFAVDWLRERGTETIYDLSKHLGHSSVTTTEIYLEHLARNPAQEHRFDREWPFDKPLAELSYSDITDPRKALAELVS